MTDIDKMYNDAIYDIKKIAATIDDFSEKYRAVLKQDDIITMASYTTGLMKVHSWLEQKRDFHEKEIESKDILKHLFDNGYSKEQLISMVNEATHKKDGIL